MHDAMTEPEPTTITIPVSDRRQRILVQRTADGILLRNPGRWELRLSLPEAWELAEAIDSLATRP